MQTFKAIGLPWARGVKNLELEDTWGALDLTYHFPDLESLTFSTVQAPSPGGPDPNKGLVELFPFYNTLVLAPKTVKSISIVNFDLSAGHFSAIMYNLNGRLKTLTSMSFAGSLRNVCPINVAAATFSEFSNLVSLNVDSLGARCRKHEDAADANRNFLVDQSEREGGCWGALRRGSVGAVDP